MKRYLTILELIFSTIWITSKRTNFLHDQNREVDSACLNRCVGPVYVNLEGTSSL